MALPSNKNLPIPPFEAQAHSQQLTALIKEKISHAGGWISFADFMHAALYTPNLGYYSGGAKKFGLGGDFVTAPEISDLFAKTVALQAAQILASGGDVLELGAGTGKLAADLLLELQTLDALPNQYFILEVSDNLRQIQRETCEKKLPAELFEKLAWLENLPEKFSGLILGNEVLDAIPAHLVVKVNDGGGVWFERGVGFDGDFMWLDTPLKYPVVVKNIIDYIPDNLPNGYLTEVCPAASGLVSSLLRMLEVGAILLIDYGFSAQEYYHPQRNQGTLMCHYQHFAHDNPLTYIGLQDITAHVNFSQIAQAGEAYGISLAGYANQAQFLINCGILDLLQQFSPQDSSYMKLAAAAQKLMSPAEMGELFKVIAFSKNMDAPLIGFVQGDKAHTL